MIISGQIGNGSHHSHAVSEWETLHPLACDRNRIYICAKCGEVWARLRFEEAKSWRALMVSCPSHRAFEFERPGSLIDYRDDLRLLPLELLRREVLLALELPWTIS